MLRDEITGTWRLLSYEARGSDGSVSYPLGRDAVGYIMYTEDGFMSVSMMASARRRYADGDLRGGTDEEKLAAADSYVSYCGRYEIQDDSVFHHVEVAFFPNRVGDVAAALHPARRRPAAADDPRHADRGQGAGGPYPVGARGLAG